VAIVLVGNAIAMGKVPRFMRRPPVSS